MPLSALAHWAYCPRQCALIHAEQDYTDNEHTLDGNRVHEQVDSAPLRVWSDTLGLTGIADIVEWHNGVPYPIEYKRGPIRNKAGDLQLCGQALCLEEMFGVAIPEGAIYHFKSRRRRTVAINDNLRQRTKAAIKDIRLMLATGSMPAPAADTRCRQCSLLDTCMPYAIAQQSAIARYAKSLVTV